VYTETSGRFIICDVKVEERCITLATLYAPNDDEPTFYRIFFDHVLDFRFEELIIGGDFNLVLDLGKDKKGGRAKTHTESIKVLRIFMAEYNLMGAWRILNPDSFQYTWRMKKTEVRCRLDFFLVSQGLMCNVSLANISVGYKTMNA